MSWTHDFDVLQSISIKNLNVSSMTIASFPKTTLTSSFCSFHKTFNLDSRPANSLIHILQMIRVTF